MWKKRKILFVDDEQNILDDLKEVFGYLDKYEIFQANSALEALAVLKNHPQIDLVITDIKMPKTDGLQLAGMIRERYPKVEIIFMTAVEERIARTVQIKPVGIVEKPLQNDDLLQKIGNHFKRTNIIKYSPIAGGVLAAINIFAAAFVEMNKPSLPKTIMAVIAALFLVYFYVVGKNLRKL